MQDAKEKIPDDLDSENVLQVHNKIDLTQSHNFGPSEIAISAKTNTGIRQLIEKIADKLFQQQGLQEHGETPFLARSRHVVALQQALQHCQACQSRMSDAQEFELAAEDLRQAQQQLSEITGEFSADDLLGKIFSEFCIGK